MSEDGLLHTGLITAAAKTPDKAALVCGDCVLSYSEVVLRATCIASEIDRAQARRVALCLPNGTQIIEAFLATVMAGACVCLFDPGWPPEMVRDLIDEHEPHIIIAGDEQARALAGHSAEERLWSLAKLNAIAADLGGAQTLQSQPTPDMPFLLGFTSGSSGKPKAFIRSHQTWAESFLLSAKELGTTSSKCVVAPGPLSHGLSLYAVIETLCAGGTAIIQSTFDPAEVISHTHARAATTLVVVPAMLDVLLDTYASNPMTSVSAIVTAGAKLPTALRQGAARAYPGADIIEYYGASELSFVTVAAGHEKPPAESVGRAFAGVEIEVRDESGRALPPGHTGIVWVRSKMISSGYVGYTDGSGFRQSGEWATVGDLGHLDAQGYLYLDGREGSAITSAGYTVYPSAIESALMSHPEVSEAVVVGLPHARWGEVIAAAVIPVRQSGLGVAALEEHCLQVLEPYACPRRWVLTEKFHRTTSGKPRRADVAKLFSG